MSRKHNSTAKEHFTNLIQFGQAAYGHLGTAKDALFKLSDAVISTGAKIKFLSLEPLLGPIQHLNLCGINWVIVGGESGPEARPVMQEWVTGIRDQCVSARVPFFFKQWGGVQKKKAGRELDGRTWEEMPANINLVKA